MSRYPKNIKNPREYAMSGFERMRQVADSMVRPGMRAEFVAFLLPELKAFEAELRARVAAEVKDMSPTFLAKRGSLIDSIVRAQPVEPEGSVPAPAHTVTVNERAVNVVAEAGGMPEEVKLRHIDPKAIQDANSPRDPVAVSPGWPAQCELYVEGFALNRKLAVARYYLPEPRAENDPVFRRVSIYRTPGIRPGLKVWARLEVGGGAPVYGQIEKPAAVA